MKDLKEQTRWRTVLIDGEYVIRGKFGQVALYKDGDLDVWVCDWSNTEEGAKRTHRRSVFIESKGWTAKQHYDDGAFFIRPPADLDQACMFIKAKRKRHMSPEQRKQNAEKLARMRSRIKRDSEKGPLSS